jgi:mycofactocin system glycosyltransferase
VTAPLPAGFGVVLDADTKQLADGILFGGSPARVMRLSGTGRAALTELLDGPVHSRAAGTLGRRLIDAGLAHPRPPQRSGALDVTVIVPVRDRAGLLDECLGALGGEHPVIVVDDGSVDPHAVAEVAARHGTKLVRRVSNGGPAAARNTGLAHACGEFVAFLDSDCAPPPGWVERLAAHFADPLVGAAAPRIVAMQTHTWAGRYTTACGSLDLGQGEARVAPLTRVAYVPTAALVVRRAALLDVTCGADVFDPGLRCGEDVDLIWRLHRAGWRVRYDPTVQVPHREPDTWPALLARRFRYGTSAAPLARRHPQAMPPLVAQPRPALTVLALLARRPALAGLGFAASVRATSRALRRAEVPTDGVVPAMGTATRLTWLGIGRYLTQFAAPLLVAAVAAGGRRRRGRRLAAASLLLGPPLNSWLARRPALDPVRFTLGHLADDLAYGAGVWTGAVRERIAVPICPVISSRMLRIDPTTSPSPSLAEH